MDGDTGKEAQREAQRETETQQREEMRRCVHSTEDWV